MIATHHLDQQYSKQLNSHIIISYYDFRLYKIKFSTIV